MEVKASNITFIAEYLTERAQINSSENQSKLALSNESLLGIHGKMKPDSKDGGGNMNDYVTHAELNHATDKLESKIDHFETKIDGSFNTLDAKIDGKFNLINEKFDRIPEQIKLALSDSEKEKQKEHLQTVRYLVGTLLIGGISAIAAIISIVISLLN